MPRYGKKRLTVDIPEAVHFRLKELSQMYNIKMTTMVFEMIMGFIKSQEPYE